MLHLRDVVHAGELPEVLPDELLEARRAPAPREPLVVPLERLGVPAVTVQGLERGLRDRQRELDDPLRWHGAGELGHGQGMHPEREVAAHQAVAPPSVDVQPGAAGDDEAEVFAVLVEEALQERLPPRVPVKLVEDGPRPARAELRQPKALGNAAGAREERGAIVLVVPAEIPAGVGHGARRGGLADLARPETKAICRWRSRWPRRIPS